MNFRIRDLRNFFESVSCRTMYEASKKLGIAQPSLSESIKRLEKDLKQILFYRSRTGIQLTPSGRSLFEKARAALTHLDGISNPTSSEKIEQNTIVIGCHSVISEAVLPPTIADLEKSTPGVNIEIVQDLSHKIQHKTQLGLIDVALVVNPFPAPDLIMKKCFFDEMRVWQSTSLYNPNRVICDVNAFHTQVILKKWKRHPKNILSSANFNLNLRLTSYGAGFGILPKFCVKQLDSKMIPVPHTPVSPIEVFIIYKPAFGRNTFERHFIETIKRTLANIKGNLA